MLLRLGMNVPADEEVLQGRRRSRIQADSFSNGSWLGWLWCVRPRQIIDLVSRYLLASRSMTVAKRAVAKSSDSLIKRSVSVP